MIDFTKSKQYTLSIRLSTDGFSFSIYNPIHDDSFSVIEKEIDTSLSLTANLKAVFHESDFLGHSYKRVNIMLASKRFTIVPLDLFEEEQADLLFYHNHQKRENETVIYNILKKNNVVIVFGIDRSAYSFLLLANSFKCSHTEDRIYYLLYAWKQLEFNQERDELHLTGTLPDKEILMNELRKFILQVFIMNPATNIDMHALLTCE